MAEKLIFLYLILFPFGQLLRMDLLGITIHSTDLVVGIIAVYTLLTTKRYPKVFGKFLSLFAVMVFSLFLNYGLFTLSSALYLIRFIAYSFLFVFVWKNFQDKKKLLTQGLLVVGVATAFFGWIQYFWQPDLTALQYFDWDDHLYRLVGAFLDPAFTGVILVFTALLAFSQKRLRLGLILVLTLAFTYSRASYLAFLAGLVFLIPKKVIKYSPLLLVAGFLLLTLLPRPAGYGVILTRTHSIIAKAQNYTESVQIIKEYPLFGVGFNNLCEFRGGDSRSHSCSGLDNSLLFIWATMGVVGLILFGDLGIGLVRNTSRLFLASAIALLVHTQFTNTLFYPWVMGWIAILWGIVYSE
ncbi:hypothetical protein A2630_00055 [Candidatus Woesebacteria bacterium RIFCSPHIGHO2_01_FULL_44_10]|uniref:O-antigen ligase-related domain-containing protein n=1 Tax=Candidatus Woesebacteria bacterium RIFCSPLOWO2_01_FULL_44_14 TaxID=1802525 RepID=A0A1F8BX77_9BACT|nr:MAG: hypothetical protein A2630_00055 [Candidatus Woesebacteria bacterium RIFCSPHIGHO2_01_FULL_44_10]OGM56267.1 MAG: hypothetical protein A3F62_03375 [Candidatus Woesebacteria bacterium RIFCSPHIGHO2_12_FULL_44_11]OGM68703.1 MAG: hypothetical protein A2975_05355 [Candidatus Woesebacteria bacterium RIFCSPLOWO2_01_FULL_44_14]